MHLMQAIGSLSLLVGAFMFYLLPAFIAAHRKHSQQVPIAIINIFLGWTILAWILTLAWASAKDANATNRDSG